MALSVLCVLKDARLTHDRRQTIALGVGGPHGQISKGCARCKPRANSHDPLMRVNALKARPLHEDADGDVQAGRLPHSRTIHTQMRPHTEVSEQEFRPHRKARLSGNRGELSKDTVVKFKRCGMSRREFLSRAAERRQFTSDPHHSMPEASAGADRRLTPSGEVPR